MQAKEDETMYKDGELIKHRDLGYIYDIESYESIVKLLTE